MTRTRLLVVQHEDDCGPDLFDVWLRGAGVQLDVVRAHRGDPMPAKLDADGLLVLGGHMGANDDETCSWLPASKELIRTVVGEGAPYLGICLGHQLASVALGGRVERNPTGTTRGVVPVGLTEAGRADQLLGAHDGDPAVHWNSDVAVALPADAELLAASPDGSAQAARFGDRAWGVQFHPEASPALVRGWAAEREPGRGVPEKVQRALGAVVAAEDRLREVWAPFARRFAGLLG